MIYVTTGVSRLVIGTVLILWQPTELAAMVSMLLGTLPARGARCLRPAAEPVRLGSSLSTSRSAPNQRASPRQLPGLARVSSLWSTATKSLPVTALDAHNAGLYAGGLIITKSPGLAVPPSSWWSPFPAMSTAHERRQPLVPRPQPHHCAWRGRSRRLHHGASAAGLGVCGWPAVRRDRGRPVAVRRPRYRSCLSCSCRSTPFSPAEARSRSF